MAGFGVVIETYHVSPVRNPSFMQQRPEKLKSYEAAKKRVMKNVEHRQHKGLNNRAENSHQPTRTRERRMRRFKSPGQAQRFLSAFEPIREHFHAKQHELSAKRY